MVNLLEALSDYAHMTWAGWMTYMFSKSTKNKDGSVTIPAELVERWSRQVGTPYWSLPENEKESDRAEARKILEIVGLED